METAGGDTFRRLRLRPSQLTCCLLLGWMTHAGLDDAGAAAELSKLVFSTLREYTDKPSFRSVERAIALGLKHQSFLKGFTGQVVKAGERENLGDHERYVLLRWACAVAESLDPVQHAAPFAKIASVIGGLILGAATAQVGPMGAADPFSFFFPL